MIWLFQQLFHSHPETIDSVEREDDLNRLIALHPFQNTFSSFFISKPFWFTNKSAFFPGKLAFLSGKLAHWPGKLAHSPGKLAFLAGKLAHSPGKLALSPGKLARSPGKLAYLTGKLANLRGKRAYFRRNLLDWLTFSVNLRAKPATFLFNSVVLYLHQIWLSQFNKLIKPI